MQLTCVKQLLISTGGWSATNDTTPMNPGHHQQPSLVFYLWMLSARIVPFWRVSTVHTSLLQPLRATRWGRLPLRSTLHDLPATGCRSGSAGADVARRAGRSIVAACSGESHVHHPVQAVPDLEWEAAIATARRHGLLSTYQVRTPRRHPGVCIDSRSQSTALQSMLLVVMCCSLWWCSAIQRPELL